MRIRKEKNSHGRWNESLSSISSTPNKLLTKDPHNFASNNIHCETSIVFYSNQPLTSFETKLKQNTKNKNNKNEINPIQSAGRI